MSEKELFDKVDTLCLQYGVSDGFKQAIYQLIKEYLSKHTMVFKFNPSTIEKIIEEKIGKRICNTCKEENSALADYCKKCGAQL